jgi:hypothetical protein
VLQSNVVAATDICKGQSLPNCCSPPTKVWNELGNVGYWHKADLKRCPLHRRCWRNSRISTRPRQPLGKDESSLRVRIRVMKVIEDIDGLDDPAYKLRS